MDMEELGFGIIGQGPDSTRLIEDVDAAIARCAQAVVDPDRKGTKAKITIEIQVLATSKDSTSVIVGGEITNEKVPPRRRLALGGIVCGDGSVVTQQHLQGGLFDRTRGGANVRDIKPGA